MLKLIKNEFIKEYTGKRIILTLCLFVGISLCVYLYNIVIPIVTKDSLGDPEEYYSSTINMYEEAKKRYEKDPNPKTLFSFKMIEMLRNESQYIKDNNISYDDWRYDAIGSIDNVEPIVLDMLLSGYELSTFYTGNERYASLNNEEIRQEYDRILIRNEQLRGIIKNGYYYDYASLALKEEETKLKEIESKKDADLSEVKYTKQRIITYEYIVDKKIESKNDYVFKEIEHLNTLDSINEFKVLSENEFYKDSFLVQSYYDYDEYFEVSTNKKAYLEDEIKKMEYAINHDIKYSANDYKNNLKIVIYMFFVIGILMIVRSSGAISEEQNSGSLRLLLTQGVSRSKVLLSKFVNILIDLYVHYFAFLIIFILVGLLFYQFKDLLIPQIDIVAGNVVLNNYFLYLLKMIFVCSIPIIFLISLSLFLSVITINTILSIGANIFVMISGLLMLDWIKKLHIDYLQYTPLPFLNMTNFLYLSNGEGYSSLHFLTSTYYLEKGIVVLIIWTILLYLVTNIIFVKRDVVNQ